MAVGGGKVRRDGLAEARRVVATRAVNQQRVEEDSVASIHLRCNRKSAVAAAIVRAHWTHEHLLAVLLAAHRLNACARRRSNVVLQTERESNRGTPC